MKCGCKIAMTGFSALVSETGLYDILHYSTHAFFKVSDVYSTTASWLRQYCIIHTRVIKKSGNWVNESITASG